MTWLMSALSLFVAWAAGSKKTRRSAWVVGLGNQALWLWFAIDREETGLILFVVVNACIYARNLMGWSRDAEATG